MDIGDIKSSFGRGGGRFRTKLMSYCLPVYSIARVPSGLQGTSRGRSSGWGGGWEVLRLATDGVQLVFQLNRGHFSPS